MNERHVASFEGLLHKIRRISYVLQWHSERYNTYMYICNICIYVIYIYVIYIYICIYSPFRKGVLPGKQKAPDSSLV